MFLVNKIFSFSTARDIEKELEVKNLPQEIFIIASYFEKAGWKNFKISFEKSETDLYYFEISIHDLRIYLSSDNWLGGVSPVRAKIVAPILGVHNVTGDPCNIVHKISEKISSCLSGQMAGKLALIGVVNTPPRINW